MITENNMISKARIVSLKSDNEAVCAAAARISTTEGNSLEIYKNSVDKDREKNNKLIGRVLGSGHESIMEHASLTIAFCNVSVLVEQFMIEFRLASFTVKSRRYVDFGKMGYYIPARLEGSAREMYVKHMDSLFEDYQAAIDKGVPREDARFLLPYCFCSNFYCTMNARELIHVLKVMLYGRGNVWQEITDLAKQLCVQLKEIFPELLKEVEKTGQYNQEDTVGSSPVRPDAENNIPTEVFPAVEMLSGQSNPGLLLEAACLAAEGRLAKAEKDSMETLVSTLLKDPRPRALEQLNYTFLIKDITLSGLTHLVRHRMQSVIIPSLAAVDRSRYIIPASVKAAKDVAARYMESFARNMSVCAQMKASGMNGYELSYFNMSGNTLNVMTTMNAREMLLFFRLRCCNRAQWEIREIAEHMLALAKGDFPVLFNRMGPSCVLGGRCPEGRLSCGDMAGVYRKYGLEMDAK